MNKKKLPKAVNKTADEMRKTGSENVAAAAQVAQPPATKLEGPEAARRRAQANAIVERYSNISVIGGMIPLPLINVAGVTVVIVRMVKLLSQLYGVPFEQGRARAIVVALAGGAMPTTAGAVTATTLFYVVPGANLVGLAVSSVTASVCTRNIGRRFVEHFETGATLFDFPVVERR